MRILLLRHGHAKHNEAKDLYGEHVYESYEYQDSELTEKGIVIECRNPNLRNIDESGKVNIFSELMMSILSTMSSFEKSLIKERQREGIRIRKEKGLYSGRRIGTIIKPEKFLKSKKSQLILNYLSKGNYSYEDISKIVPCSKTTIVKVKKMSELNLN